MDDRTEVVGFTSHNARVVQIRRFCMNPAHGAELLRLAAAGEEGAILCAYPKDDCVSDRGHTIPEAVSMALEEHAEAVQGEVIAILAWCRANGDTITTKRLRARPSARSPALPGTSLEEMAALVGDGDQRAFVQHAIRASEFYLRSNLQSHHQTLQQQRELAEVSMEQAKMSGAMAMEMYAKTIELMQNQSALQLENIQLRAQVEALQSQLAELTEQDPNVSPEEAEARAELVRSVTDGVVKAAPEAWQMFKIWLVSQAGKANAAAANGANGHGAVNGHGAAQ